MRNPVSCGVIVRHSSNNAHASNGRLCSRMRTRGEYSFAASFVGRRLRTENLIASLEVVANVSDEYDEKLVARYGGETAIERLRSGGFRPPVQLAARKADSN